jgi:cytokinesis protein
MHPQKHIEVRLCISILLPKLTLYALPVNLQDVRKSLTDLREGLKRIKQELADHFSDMEQADRYGKQMWSFVRKASGQVEDLVDDVNHADATFNEVVRYYGEEDRNMSSSEFYGIFKTFVTSYRVRFTQQQSALVFIHANLSQKCKADNQSILEERLALEKRKAAAEEAKLNRVRAREAAAVDDAENDAVLDNLLAKLRNGDNVGRKARRTRQGAANRPAAPLDLSGASLLASGTGNETVDLARDMLARLKSDGFDAITPTSPTTSIAPHRRSRRRIRGISEDLDLDGSPMSQTSGIPAEGQDPSLDSVVEQTAEADVGSPTSESPSHNIDDGGGEKDAEESETEHA